LIFDLAVCEALPMESSNPPLSKLARGESSQARTGISTVAA